MTAHSSSIAPSWKNTSGDEPASANRRSLESALAEVLKCITAEGAQGWLALRLLSLSPVRIRSKTWPGQTGVRVPHGFLIFDE